MYAPSPPRALGPAGLLIACAFGLSASALVGCAAPPARSVVLVSLDTTRADRLGAYGGPAGLTPNLDHFAEEAVVFTHAYSQATVTGPSHASILTSRYPTEVFSGGPRALLGHDKPLISEMLHAYGYATGAFVSGGALAPATGLTPGFDVYQSPTNFGSLAQTVPLALRWLDQQPAGKPTFVFVHGYDAHSPTAKPPPFDGEPPTGLAKEILETRSERIMAGKVHASDVDIPRVDGHVLRMHSAEGTAAFEALDPNAPTPTDADLARVRAAYDDAVAWSDAWFGTLMEGLASRGRLDDTVVIVLADHGEQLGEHGFFNHCCGAGDEETHVPLLVRGPDFRPHEEDGIVELIDVLPTVADVAHARPPAGIHGRSFYAALRGSSWDARDVAWTEGASRFNIVSGRTLEGRLTYTGLLASNIMLPPLLAGARLDGPGFTITGSPDAPALRDQMVAWLGTLSPVADTGGAVPMSPQLLQDMRAHGYFGAGQ